MIGKRVLMLLQSTFPPDIRIEREIKSLSNSGYIVGIICNQFIKNLEPEFNYATIFRISAIFNSEKLNKILNFPLFFNPRFLAKAIKVFLAFKPSIIHAHDLPMVPLALVLKWIFRASVIFDMHESYPDALEAFKKRGIINYVFKNASLARRLENYCLRYVDEIIVVVDDHKERLIKRGISGKQINVVSNTVDLEIYQPIKYDSGFDQRFRGKFILLYTGGISPDRGLEIPIKSISILKKEIPNILLLIIGDGAYSKTLENVTKLEKAEDFVKFVGWPGHNELGPYLDLADICIIPQPSNEYINSGIPNKFFEYMSQGKPILACSLPMERIINETSCGEVFNSGDYRDFALKIIEMSIKTEQYRDNGINAVATKYNWSKDEKTLLSLYNSELNKLK